MPPIKYLDTICGSSDTPFTLFSLYPDCKHQRLVAVDFEAVSSSARIGDAAYSLKSIDEALGIYACKSPAHGR